MSKVEVDQVDPQSGTTLTLGTSGDTVSIPSGVTLANAGTATGTFPAPTSGIAASAIDSGTIATARLGSGTANSSTFLRGDQTYAAVPGGLSVADQWRLTSNFTITSASTTDITSNLERVDTAGQGVIGAMTESSGIFTFPSTGFYLVTANFSYSLAEDSQWIEGAIQATINNASYADMVSQNTFIYKTQGATTYQTIYVNSLIDVTSTSNVKVKFGVASATAGSGGVWEPLLLGNTNSNATYFTFLRLGDT